MDANQCRWLRLQLTIWSKKTEEPCLAWFSLSCKLEVGGQTFRCFSEHAIQD